MVKANTSIKRGVVTVKEEIKIKDLKHKVLFPICNYVLF